ncbi:pyrimidine 5'-nucleotidase [Vibrio europaeus]|uniref:DUMP phosphatase n=1 Tax=Vibrio europaeus TaxID=300876 RepID=A0A178J632_9VIBR|nr:pyrimidine 5'-nucleotidase [Vibrio europaeus]MDC5706193.1 pyrimidine 5'-nucleotidase [Vibrio europaeus]MDC5709603.1 pyrimidine 5'-nucleotidase [Vibrio europaeus]MDC5714002.1 pyrimidine 5'-nucleotidase [Vibrio europaeus]MDC5720741.1 pyrimidine 5'-nucleotidase [Vibrio europaeus]MDC5723389.1 pyrimidine 5'-nucleotidase [Vibrio europaeus]
MKYDWILFDADETLFHFDAFKGMQLMFSRKGIDFTQGDFEHYQKINKPLWVDYQNGAITAHELKHTRFKEWADKLETTTSELNSSFLEAMADICTVLPGAKELMEAIHGNARMGIITNGFTDLQAIRLEKTGMSQYFEHVIISEEVGVAKPDTAIFSHALEKMGMPCKSKVLMVGDNQHSDILGGLNFGIETCWLNSNGMEQDHSISPHYTVSSLHQLKEILIA